MQQDLKSDLDLLKKKKTFPSISELMGTPHKIVLPLIKDYR